MANNVSRQEIAEVSKRVAEVSAELNRRLANEHVRNIEPSPETEHGDKD